MAKMSYGGGMGNGMLATFTRNNAMLKGKSYFDTREEFLKIAKKVQLTDPKKATPEQLKQIRVLIKIQRRRKFVMKIWVLLIAGFITAAGLWLAIQLVRLVFGF